MFAVLDTNHLRELRENTLAAQRLARRIDLTEASVFTCIVVAEEALQGWLALIHRHRAGAEQIAAYARFQEAIEVVSKLSILPFDRDAADQFHQLQTQRLRVGTMDLKIAAICLAHEATLLTRNLGDFERIPGLRVENWLD